MSRKNIVFLDRKREVLSQEKLFELSMYLEQLKGGVEAYSFSIDKGPSIIIDSNIIFDSLTAVLVELLETTTDPELVYEAIEDLKEAFAKG